MQRSCLRLLKVKVKAETSIAASASARSYGASKACFDVHDKTDSYATLYHHKKPDLFPYRNPGSLSYVAYHITSAANALLSLLSSQESRDQFLSLTGSSPSDGEFINSDILGQASLGFVKVLTLYGELSNPLYKEHPKFNVREFLEGSTWALEQFHRTKREVLLKLLSNIIPEDDGESKKIRELNFTTGYDFADVARKDPNSIEFAFCSMTTPEVLTWLQLESVARISGEIAKGVPPVNAAKILEEDAKVMNLALLSATVKEIEPSLTQEGNGNPKSELKDDSHQEPNTQVVTQLEVLYEMQQSVINDEEKVMTKTSVMVAKFEACLDGNPDGTLDGEGLRWRLAGYRPAIEFGHHTAW